MGLRKLSLVSGALGKLYKHCHEVIKIGRLHPIPVDRPDELHGGLVLLRGRACSAAGEATPEVKYTGLL